MSLSTINRLPLQLVGLNDIPAVPYILDLFEPLGTLLKLALREVETIPAKHGLSTSYTISNQTGTAYEFIYGRQPCNFASEAIDALKRSLEADPEGLLKSVYNPTAHKPIGPKLPVRPPAMTSLSLDDPAEFAMSWTAYEGVYQQALPLLPAWSSSLSNAGDATTQFWPTIATHNAIAIGNAGRIFLLK